MALYGAKYPLLTRTEQTFTTGSSFTFSGPYDWLVLTHTSTIAALTVVFPSSPKDGDIVKISNLAAVTAVTYSPTVPNSNSGLAAGAGAEFFWSSTYNGGVGSWLPVKQ